MAANLGVRIGIEGGKDFIDEVRRITSETKALKSAFEDVSHIKDPIEKSAAQFEVLGEAIAKGEDKIRVYMDQLEKASSKYGDNSGQANRWREEIFKANTELSKLKESLDSISTKTITLPNIGTFKDDLKTMSEAVSTFQKEFSRLENQDGVKGVFGRAEGMKDSLTSAIQAQEEVVRLLAEDYEKAAREQGKFSDGALNIRGKLADATKELEAMGRQLRDLPNGLMLLGDELNKVGDKMQGIGSKFNNAAKTFAPVSGLASGALTGIAKTSMEYDTQMRRVRAIVKETADDEEDLLKKMQAVEQAVMDMDSIYNKTELMAGMEQIIRAGWDGDEAIQALAATVNLATIEQMNMDSAATGLSHTIKQFGGSAEEASHYADVLAITSAATATDVSELLQALTQAAPAAAAAGAGVEDVALLLGLMADNGIIASRSGTAVKNMFANLIEPTSKDAAAALDKFNVHLFDLKGNLRDVPTVMNELRTNFKGLAGGITDLDDSILESDEAWQSYKASLPTSDQERLSAIVEVFGKRALPGVLAVINSAEDDYLDLASAIDECSGAAREMAEEIESGPEGEWQKLKADVQQLALEFGKELLPVLKDVLEWARTWIQRFQGMDDGTKKLILTVMAGLAIVSPVLGAIGNITNGIGGMIKTSGDLVHGIGHIIKKVSDHGGLIPTVLSLGTHIKTSLIGGINKLLGTGAKIPGGIQQIVGAVGTKGSGLIGSITNASGAIGGGSTGLIGSLGSLVKAAAPFLVKGAVIAGVVAGVAYLGVQVYRHFDDIKKWAYDLSPALGKAIEGVGNFFKGVVDTVKNLASTAMEAGRGLVKNIADGISSSGHLVFGAATGIAKSIKSLLHHSTPDEGPLKDDDEWMPDMMRQFADGIKDNTGLVTNAAKNAGAGIETMKKEAVASVDKMKNEMMTLTKAIADDTVAQFGYTKDEAEARIKELQTGTAKTMETMQRLTAARADQMKSDVVQSVEGMQHETAILTDAIKNNVIQNFGMTKDQAMARIDELKHESSLAMNDMKTAVSGSADDMQNSVTKSVRQMKDNLSQYVEETKENATRTIGALAEKAGDTMRSLADSMGAYGSKINNNLTTGLHSTKNKVKSAVTNVTSGIKDEVESIMSKASNWGYDLGDGLASGLRKTVDRVKDAAKSVAATISNYLHFSTPDIGPLKHADTFMPDFMKLLASGIKNNVGMVERAAERAANAIRVTPSVYLPDARMASNTVSMGGINFTINAQPGQDVNELAEAVEARLVRMIERQQYAYS